MTTAYDFPDLNISPILGEEQSDEEDVERGIDDEAVPIQDVLKGLSVSENMLSMNTLPVESSGGVQRLQPFSYDHSQQIGNSFDASSEMAFAALDCDMKRSLFSIAESCDIAGDFQESFCSILSGCRICVEMGCCTASSEDVRSRLRRMGAVVSRHLTETTTHVVFSFGGRASTLRRVFALPTRPFLVDPHWVYECFKSGSRVSEEQFSLYDCRFLVDALRKSLDARNVSDNAELFNHGVSLEHGHGVSVSSDANEGRLFGRRSEDDVTFSGTMSASELLLKIDLLSKRLDKIGGITTCVLGDRCPSVLKGKLFPTVHEKHAEKNRLKSHPEKKILRRRTHGAFPLEYREPLSSAVQIRRETTDEQNAVCGRSKPASYADEEDLSVCDENQVPQMVNGRYKSNAQSKRTNRKNLKEKEASDLNQSTRRCLRALENSSDETGGLLGLRTPSHGGAYGPLVETASSLINQLQLASSSEEFVGKKRPLVVAKSRNGIIFTGFPKEKEREFHSDVISLGFKVQAQIGRRTYCVVSANGERTLNTMRAVISGIPVVKKEWIDACMDENRFLPLDEFQYERWQKLIQNREQLRLLFSEMGKIFVCDDCSPPTDDLKWIIKECGGEITTDPCECSLVVAPRNHSLEISCSEEVDCPPPVVVEKYILDCVSENMVLTLDDYMEHDVVDDLC